MAAAAMQHRIGFNFMDGGVVCRPAGVVPAISNYPQIESGFNEFNRRAGIKSLSSARWKGHRPATDVPNQVRRTFDVDFITWR
jgi:hypothetical protein